LGKTRLSAPERRDVILQAGARLFAEHGFERASLDVIADASGISKRVIYDHFESKRHLHLTLLEHETERLLDHIRTRVAQATSVEESVYLGADAFFEFVETHPFAWRLLFRDPPGDAEIGAFHRELHARATAMVASLFHAQAAADGEVSSAEAQTIEMLAEMFKRAMNGLAGWWYEHADVPREHVVATFVRFAWLGLERLAADGGPTPPPPPPRAT
jgi:AcrR family transcriptional regulator